jgi:hypothetical protein
VDRSDISDAIQLFEYSQTVRAGGRASDVVRSLWNLYKRNEIGFRIQPDKSWVGSHSARADYDIQANPIYFDGLPAKERLGALSLLLVHEAVHEVLVMWDKRLESEIAARMLEIHYYRELSGPGVFNEANDPPRQVSRGEPFGCRWTS